MMKQHDCFLICPFLGTLRRISKTFCVTQTINISSNACVPMLNSVTLAWLKHPHQHPCLIKSLQETVNPPMLKNTHLITVVVQPPHTPGDPRTSQHCILACTAGLISWCAVNRDGLALSLSLYKSSELGHPGAPWPHRELLMPGVAPAWWMSDLYSPGSTGIVQLLSKYQDGLMWIVTRTEKYWCLKSIILRPYKQQYQGRLFELFWSAARCAQWVGRFSE